MGIALLAPVNVANAATNSLSPAEEQGIRTFYTQYGVSVAAQNAVITRLKAGIMPQSDTGASPVGTQVISKDAQYVVKRLTYSDGSISISTVSNLEPKKSPAGAVSPMSVSGCTQTSGGSFAVYYKNCVARHQTTLVTIAFRFDYENIRGTGGNISHWCCEEDVAILGTYSGSFSLINSTTLRYSGQFVYYSGIASITRWMQVRVSGGSAYTQMN